MSTISRISIL